jgi:hypothetical protein
VQRQEGQRGEQFGQRRLLVVGAEVPGSQGDVASRDVDDLVVRDADLRERRQHDRAHDGQDRQGEQRRAARADGAAKGAIAPSFRQRAHGRFMPFAPIDACCGCAVRILTQHTTFEQAVWWRCGGYLWSAMKI